MGKKKITLKNIKQFLEGNSKMLAAQVGFLAPHIAEQVAYRMLLCKDCLIDGACKYCGCDVPGKLYVWQSCNDGERFPDMMNQEDWIKFKETNDIK